MTARVRLDLTPHCVQTAARHEHARLQARLLADRAGPDDAARLDLLREFLETTDFRALRAERPELAGGSPVWLELRREADGALAWSVCGPPGAGHPDRR